MSIAHDVSKKSDWLVPAALIALSIAPAIGGSIRMTQLASGVVTSENARFFASPIPVIVHVLCVVPFSFLGALQFSAGFRRRHRTWHRVAGRVLVACGFGAALSALWMTLFYAWAPGDGRMVYVERLIFGSAMLASLVLGVNAIRRRDFASHEAWMIRAYAIGMGAGTQVFTHLPWFIVTHDAPGELARGLMMGAGWVLNVIVAELIILPRKSIAHAFLSWRTT